MSDVMILAFAVLGVIVALCAIWAQLWTANRQKEAELEQRRVQNVSAQAQRLIEFSKPIHEKRIEAYREIFDLISGLGAFSLLGRSHATLCNVV